jgi:hypothetical protein
MNLAAPFRELVERKLWPIALVLLLALIAGPMLLARGGDEPLPATPAGAAMAAKAQAATEPVVQVTDASSHDLDRKVLGTRKDPFAPVAVKAAKARVAAPSVDSDAAKTDGGATSGGANGSAPVKVGGGTTGGAPSPTAPAVEKPRYKLHSLFVRFGETGKDALPYGNLPRLLPLPSHEAPVIIYLGMLRDGKTSVWLVDNGVTVQGDGKCDPSPANCQQLHLKVGETSFFDATVEGRLTQFQLDVVKVVKKRTANAKKAKAAYSRTAKGGRDALRARASRLGRLRYDSRSGTVRKLSVKAWKAQAARAAASAAVAAAG